MLYFFKRKYPNKSRSKRPSSSTKASFVQLQFDISMTFLDAEREEDLMLGVGRFLVGKAQTNGAGCAPNRKVTLVANYIFGSSTDLSTSMMFSNSKGKIDRSKSSEVLYCVYETVLPWHIHLQSKLSDILEAM